MNYSLVSFGQQAVLIQFKEPISLELHLYIKSLFNYLKTQSHNGIVSLIPAYDSLTVIFHPKMTNQKEIKNLISSCITNISVESEPEQIIHYIPVCYEIGLDIGFVTQQLGLSISEIIKLHTQPDYLIYFLGFMPGFMYLEGLNSKLHLLRKKEPRLKVPKGSVAIGATQTGVYPFESPGGWQIIGKSPSILFGSNNNIKMGDYVNFYPIDSKEYNQMLQNPTPPKTAKKCPTSKY